ncbi:MAG: flotillin-like FloA family protein [Thermoguttaceae bacterium]|jgi:uncharacterized protein YqfA (UPF0365 family)|nr:flotillin-like FloA family protein [Thermoguttaceae bacterium]
MLIAQVEPFVILAVVAFLFVASLVVLSLIGRLFTPWFQATMSGVRLSVYDIIGMRLRGTDVKAVIQALVMAHHAGAPLSVTEVERAFLQGVDLEKVILAYVRAKKDDMDVTFQELVEADLEHRLEEKLAGR